MHRFRLSKSHNFNQDWYASQIPDVVQDSADANGIIGKFSKGKGAYLAIGRVDGFVSIYDFSTMSVIQWLRGHVRSVAALSCVFAVFFFPLNFRFDVLLIDGRATVVSCFQHRETGPSSSGT